MEHCSNIIKSAHHSLASEQGEICPLLGVEPVGAAESEKLQATSLTDCSALLENDPKPIVVDS